MTAQAGDIYKYENKSYKLVAASAHGLFEPKDYGLEAHPSCTACYRGYWCEYDIADNELILRNLFLFNKNDDYPTLNGVCVSPKEYVEYSTNGADNPKSEKIRLPAFFGHRVYKNIKLGIPYTGKILLGDGFIQDYYIHMGFQRAWAYKKLIELIFEDGILLQYNDLSHIAKNMRDIMKDQGVNPRYPIIEDIPKFVEDSFSLDYSVKVWWED